MDIHEGCTTPKVQWSIVDSASSNSQLAGVLAGLLVATITVLISSGKLREVRTLGIFAAAMVALALDSYLFSYLTGLNVTTAGICARAWAQGMAASGVLAIGGVALMTGIAVMLVQHLVTLEDDPTQTLSSPDETRKEKIFILWIAAAMSAAVVAATTILLAAAFQQYFRFVVSGWAWLVWGAFMVSVATVILSWLAIFRRTKTIQQAIQSNASISIETNLLPWTSLTVVGYALVASGFGGAMIYGNDFASSGWGIFATYFLTVAIPAGISLVSSWSVPKQI
ncbi:hypothetical protein GOPIP_079_00190 [Gordonia polyisoprenivorans NBRC 16320 = JCM 10675]|uniref:Transmembrane protein n=1 Tax=Gordonia polyisoprenivorans TaxID=84595 RepID=A0A846WTN6_9ACTN|nr:hypothetical protein [Gordonia polyisoprenivorans]NKY04984.1 hypothetical protein [Gordonia polyisoprenivorans]QUD82565.1 hypothetical protein J8M97_23215 [Gordonia polyisoprenivorans]GAB25330.1 hypothetical protein GOPIP_079_00190 [Gordonia polyisoprenivorans NBRC 16320 = JCM 10675]